MSNDVKSFGSAPQRITAMRPSEYRLGTRAGAIVLQGYYAWTEGSLRGGEWRDEPIVNLDEVSA